MVDLTDFDILFDRASKTDVWKVGCRNNISAEESQMYEGWNFNSGNYLFTADTK